MKKYIIWQPEAGQTEDDAALIKAHDPREAVEKWAERDDSRSCEFTISGGQPATVIVRQEGSTDTQEWIVSGEMVRSYSAMKAR